MQAVVVGNQGVHMGILEELFLLAHHVFEGFYVFSGLCKVEIQ